jgi:hypothetical protein
MVQRWLHAKISQLKHVCDTNSTAVGNQQWGMVSFLQQGSTGGLMLVPSSWLWTVSHFCVRGAETLLLNCKVFIGKHLFNRTRSWQIQFI